MICRDNNTDSSNQLQGTGGAPQGRFHCGGLSSAAVCTFPAAQRHKRPQDLARKGSVTMKQHLKAGRGEPKGAEAREESRGHFGWRGGGSAYRLQGKRVGPCEMPPAEFNNLPGPIEVATEPSAAVISGHVACCVPAVVLTGGGRVIRFLGLLGVLCVHRRGPW